MHVGSKRTTLRTLMAAAVASLMMGTPTGAAAADTSVPDQIIVRLQDPSLLPVITQQYGLTPTPLDQMSSHGLYLLAVADGTSADSKAQALAADPRITFAEPDLMGAAPEEQGMSSWESGDPAAYQSQWAPTALHLAEAHRVTGGRGITVAVLDSGVDLHHPALAGRLSPGYDFVDNDADPSEALTGPGVGHGTHLAGLVALAAPDAQIMPVRVLDGNGAGDMWRLARGLVWASDPDGNPATHDGADVINLSLSTFTRSHLMTDLIGEVADDGHGVVIVAAAGNNASVRPEFPAAEGGSRLLSVGATSSPGTTLAAFSNHGSWVDVAAPGERILSTIPGGGFATWSGTSMATALASGEVALVRSAFPQLSAQKVVDQVVSSATRTTDGTPARLDAAAAVTNQTTAGTGAGAANAGVGGGGGGGGGGDGGSGGGGADEGSGATHGGNAGGGRR